MLFETLLPFTCFLCSHYSTRKQDICDACLNDLPKITNPCERCAKPLPSSTLSLICGDCLSHSPPFHSTHTLFAYRSPVTRIVMQLKFNHALLNARIFGELLAEKIQHHFYSQQSLPELIIPVPLHTNRLKERGFNQALEIAKPISSRLQIPIDKTSCLRIKNTFAQATLYAQQRQENIKKAFKVMTDLANKHIAVVDDVITTGNTITEFCQTLKKAGAKRIDVWCCARAVLSI